MGFFSLSRCRCVHWSVCFCLCIFAVSVCSWFVHSYFFSLCALLLLFSLLFSGSSCSVSFARIFVEFAAPNSQPTSQPSSERTKETETHRHRHTIHNYFAHSSVCVCDGHTKKKSLTQLLFASHFLYIIHNIIFFLNSVRSFHSSFLFSSSSTRGSSLEYMYWLVGIFFPVHILSLSHSGSVCRRGYKKKSEWLYGLVYIYLERGSLARAPYAHIPINECAELRRWEKERTGEKKEGKNAQSTHHTHVYIYLSMGI